MRRRLVVVMVGLVAGALVLAGVGTFLLAGRGERLSDVTDVTHQAHQVADEVPLVLRTRQKVRSGVFTVLRESAGLHFAVVTAGGRIRGNLPDTLAGTLPAATLRHGKTVSGSVGADVYAAVPVPSVTATEVRRVGAGGLLVAVLVQRPPPTRLGVGYLLLVSGIALAVAALVALWLSRRITQPLTEAVSTTRRIAGGDLDARVPDQPGRYPELASLTSSINAMAVHLAETRAHQREFLLSISHDLRTPLTSILGYAEAIADGTAADTAAAAGVIGAEGRRLSRLVSDLLELARLETRQFSLRVADVDAGEIVRTTVEGLRPAMADGGVSLDVQVPAPGTLWARADADRLSQVVANLSENAFKFAARRVRVWAGPHDSVVRIVVDDDGPGIAVAEQRQVFYRFYQAPGRTPARQAGSGLGLAIVAELVSAMGGHTEVRSPTMDGGGTQMEVWLPAVHGVHAAHGAHAGATTTAVP